MILAEHSKRQTNRVVQWIGSDPERFHTLLQLFLAGEYRVTQRAAWALSCCVEAHPTLAGPHLPRIVANLERKDVPVVVKRNTVRLLQYTKLPPDCEGAVMTHCFRYIADPKEAAAVKAFSLTVLDNLSRRYPEIRSELELIIRERWEQETPAFRSRARKILKTVP